MGRALHYPDSRGHRSLRGLARTALVAFGVALVLGASLYHWRAVPQYPLPRSPSPAIAPARGAAAGPLRVLATNPRYFTDGSGRAVLLVGDHTWANLQDNGFGDPPPAFDYDAYLRFLVAHNINFFRLWVWEQARWASWVSDDGDFFNPGPPYRRTGPGLALDGKPRFDLDQLDDAYFARLRARVQAAGRVGIYVSIMLFNGWCIDDGHGKLHRGNPWRGHPFNRDNNVNGVDGDANRNGSGEETQQLLVPAVTAYQEAYVRRVLETVADLDNVLFEISNESYASSRDWQYHMIDFIHRFEASRPKQHPVGMTQYEWPGSNAELLSGPADWISPWPELPAYPYRTDPPDLRGAKVVIVDTDHLWGIGGDRKWAWKTFMRGNHPSFMDAYDGEAIGVGSPPTWDVRRQPARELIKQMLHRRPHSEWNPDAPQWTSLRANLGYIRAFAERIDLAHAVPDRAAASTGFALVHAGAGKNEFLVYAEDSRAPVEVDLSHARGVFVQEWFDPASGRTVRASPVNGGARRALQSPFAEDAVLYLYALQGEPSDSSEDVR